jgi:hypothetical protein
MTLKQHSINRDIENELKSNPVINFNTPTLKMVGGDEINLFRGSLPTGKKIKVIRAGVGKMDGATDVTDLQLEVYNNTDSTSVYTTNNDFQQGTYNSPLAVGGEGDDISVKITNNTGGEVNVSAFCSVVIE